MFVFKAPDALQLQNVMLAPVRQASQEADFNQVKAGIETRVSPPKSGTLATKPLNLIFVL